MGSARKHIKVEGSSRIETIQGSRKHQQGRLLMKSDVWNFCDEQSKALNFKNTSHYIEFLISNLMEISK